MAANTKGTKLAPFSMYSSSATGGYITTISSSFKPGVDLTNMHTDTYGESDAFVHAPLQGPFTENHVGGHSHRHIATTINPAKTGSTSRPEAWHLELGSNQIKIHGPDNNTTDTPRARLMREEFAKRPVNIRNIQTRPAPGPIAIGGRPSSSIGNYHKPYEVLQVASDRKANNRYFVKNEGLSITASQSTAITGTYEFALPDKATGSSKNIFISRFSAPGGPEVSRVCLDIESEEKSPYNALTYRNLSVRIPMQSLLKRHTGQFGFDSSKVGTILPTSGYSAAYTGSASFHKTHRNLLRRIEFDGTSSYSEKSFLTGVVHDNWYVQHPIPRSDLQYRWITSSYLSTRVLGHAPAEGVLSSALGGIEPAIDFVSSSDFGTYSSSAGRVFGTTKIAQSADTNMTQFIPTDFVGLNTNIYEPITASSNFLGHSTGSAVALENTALYLNGTNVTGYSNDTISPAEAATLNAILLHRNGPYQYPSWKQLRTGEHPVAKYLKNKNIVSFLDGIDKNIKKTEAPISDNHPMQTEIKGTEITHTYTNNLQMFADGIIDEKLGVINTSKQIYDDLLKLYKGSPQYSLENLSYRETIFPKKTNAYLGKVRARENYTETAGESSDHVLGDQRTFWRNDTADRLRTPGTAQNSQGFAVWSPTSGTSATTNADLSVWPLDSDNPWISSYEAVALHWSGRDGSLVAGITDGMDSKGDRGNLRNGELSCPTEFSINKSFEVYTSGLRDAGLTGSALVGERGTRHPGTASLQYEFLNHSHAWVRQGGVTSQIRIAGHHMIPSWSVGEQAGKNPWFDSYDDYAQDIRVMAKGYSIAPEFRISEHMEYYLDNGFTAKNNKFLSLPGNTLSSSISGGHSPKIPELAPLHDEFFKTYSYSDFMKYFSVIKEDHVGIKTPSRITLQCSAIKKLLPYQGFYPVLRTVQLGSLFSQSFGPNISGSVNGPIGGPEQLQTLLQPLFAPGILYNTIKSGIAVDYPVFTGSGPTVTNASYTDASACTAVPNYRLPFETLVDPQRYLPISSSDGKNSLFFNNPICTQMMADRSPARPAAPSSPDVSFCRGTYVDWNGTHDVKYDLAMHNFLGEIPRFFLKDESLTTITSAPQGKLDLQFVSGATYYMDVVLRKTKDMVMYEGPSEIRMATVTDGQHGNITYGDPYGHEFFMGLRGTHYGPSYKVQNGVTHAFYGDYHDPSFAPHTPPYFYGVSRARLAFSPHKFDPDMAAVGKFTFDQILEGARFETTYHNNNEYDRIFNYGQTDLSQSGNPDDRWHAGHLQVSGTTHPVGAAQMQISSSVNLFGKTKIPAVKWAALTGQPLEINQDPSEEYNTWTISTKFETPVLNFSASGPGVWAPPYGPIKSVDGGPLGGYTNSLAGANATPYGVHHPGNDSPIHPSMTTRGMWKTYGSFPSGSAGIWLELKESFPEVVFNQASVKKSLTGSLLQKCGFSGKPSQRVGEIAEYKTIHEAVVAIPFDQKGNFFAIDKAIYENQLVDKMKAGFAVPALEQKTTSITDMVEKMERYVIPPHLDFVTNPQIDPFVMYILEFEHIFSKQDLADIWQGVMPQIATNAEFSKDDEGIVTHALGKNEFFGGEDIPHDTRWMVFKVKQRAESSYYNVTADTEDDKRFKFDFKFGKDSTPPYSYNWPYDFFTLIELIKLDVEVEFESGSMG